MLDIQGNHDVFNVKDNELYRKYGHANLEENQEYYSYKSINSDRVYNFIPVVAARYPGLKKPHNFIGKVQNLETLENISSEDTKSINFFYGHFPRSCLLDSLKMRHLFAQKAYAYFSGHLHTGYNWINEMWMLQRYKIQETDQEKTYTSYLESELGDWKDYRRYRIFVVDNGVFSFKDFTFTSQTDLAEKYHIIPSFPKDIRQLIPDNKEPVFAAEFGQIRFFLISQKNDPEKFQNSDILIHLLNENQPTQEKIPCTLGSRNLVKCNLPTIYLEEIPEQDLEYSIFINNKRQPYSDNLIIRKATSIENNKSLFEDVNFASKMTRVILMSHAIYFFPLGYFLLLFSGLVILFSPFIVEKFRKFLSKLGYCCNGNYDNGNGNHFRFDSDFNGFLPISNNIYRSDLLDDFSIHSSSSNSGYFKFYRLFQSDGCWLLRKFIKYWLCLAVLGPWSIGYVLDKDESIDNEKSSFGTSNLGIIGPFGVFFYDNNGQIRHHYEPSVYLEGVRTLFSFWLPIIFMLPWIVNSKYNYQNYVRNLRMKRSSEKNTTNNNNILERNEWNELEKLKQRLSRGDDQMSSNSSSSSTRTGLNQTKIKNKKHKAILHILIKILQSAISTILAYKGLLLINKLSKFLGYGPTVLTSIIFPYHSAGFVVYSYFIYFIWSNKVNVYLMRYRK